MKLFSVALYTLLIFANNVMALIHPIDIRGKHFFDSVIDKPV